MQSDDDFNIGIVVSRFNEAVTKALLEDALQRLNELGFAEQQVKVVWVPGAGEIPLIAQQMAKMQHYAAVICLGAVIQGETRHFEDVCQRVLLGCQRVMLDYHIPVIQGVLTVYNEQQAWDRVHGKVAAIGRESVDVAVEMVNTLKTLNA